jgi:hypothetical protein
MAAGVKSKLVPREGVGCLSLADYPRPPPVRCKDSQFSYLTPCRWRQGHAVHLPFPGESVFTLEGSCRGGGSFDRSRAPPDASNYNDTAAERNPRTVVRYNSLACGSRLVNLSQAGETHRAARTPAQQRR